MAHFYRVELARRVRLYAGCSAYRLSIKRKDFPFGKAHELKRGADALAKAQAFAEEHMSEAGSVSIWRLTGAGNGHGNYVKSDTKQLFDSDWSS
jgi:hypothetical protein